MLGTFPSTPTITNNIKGPLTNETNKRICTWRSRLKTLKQWVIVYRLWFNCVLALVFNHTILLRVWLWLYMVMSLELTKQPNKLKFLLGRHLAINSFGLGRPWWPKWSLLAGLQRKIKLKPRIKQNHNIHSFESSCMFVTRFVAPLSGDIRELKQWQQQQRQKLRAKK